MIASRHDLALRARGPILAQGSRPVARIGAAALHRRPDMRHLLCLSELSAAEIRDLLSRADRHAGRRAEAGLPLDCSLAGRAVANLFFEDSTRTRNSFSLAAQRLGAQVLHFSSGGSSTSKGESVLDTLRTIEAMGVDVMVVRHACAGVAHQAARALACAVINAGDGRHAHPTQGLLDMLTLQQKLGDLAGRRLAIVGDIVNSRVARTALVAAITLGMHVTLVGPATLLPRSFASLGAELSHDLDAVLPGVDAVIMLRIQQERIGTAAYPSLREFVDGYGLTPLRLRACKPDVAVLHPGPMNRGVEIDAEVADGPNSLVLRQVSNGVAVRMAALEWCCGVQ